MVKSQNAAKNWLKKKFSILFGFGSKISRTRLNLDLSSNPLVHRNGRIDITVLYLQRYIRLTPLLGVCILMLVSLYRFTGSGPLWDHMIDLQTSRCKNNWWAALLYVHNYVHPNEIVCAIFVICLKLYFLNLLIIYSF